MHITLLEPFYTGSHKSWADSLSMHSSNEVEILSLEGRFWKWRMHGGAISLAKQFLEKRLKTDLILATDMLDLSLFCSLTKGQTASIPTAIYFHENQMTYPWSPKDSDVEEGRDLHYGFINYSSALVADQIYFNSKFHMNSFLGGCERLLSKFPDHRETSNLKDLERKASVLPLGVELSRFDQYKEEAQQSPLILWNHRWEYDKNPELFFESLLKIKKEGYSFQLCVLGQRTEKVPEIFNKLPEFFSDELVQFGPVDSFEEYATWLWRANIHPTTSNQDFFGVSVVEGIYCECTPILPRRLAYPEHVSDPAVFYQTEEQFVDCLRQLIIDQKNRNIYSEEVNRYDWSQLIGSYDQAFNNQLQDD
jgi:glycosyltransferase involved in cell wall biosynthesis